MLQENQIIGSLVVDHLGLISSVIDKIDLISKIDAGLPVVQEKDAKPTMGERVGVMILNGLGVYVRSPLYVPSILAQ